MTFEQMLEQVRNLPISEVRRHARVSLANAHACHDCFCCACLQVWREWIKANGEK